jgi:hypothetical protein
VNKEKLKRKWSMLAHVVEEEARPEAALFHDPSLFYKDQDKNRSKDAMHEETKEGKK